MAITLGRKVKDKITGVEGIAVARTEWMHGCVRIIVQPLELKDGRPVETCTFDEPDLDIICGDPTAEAEAPTHGWRPDPVRR